VHEKLDFSLGWVMSANRPMRTGILSAAQTETPATQSHRCCSVRSSPVRALPADRDPPSIRRLAPSERLPSPPPRPRVEIHLGSDRFLLSFCGKDVLPCHRFVVFSLSIYLSIYLGYEPLNPNLSCLIQFSVSSL
jgi:hypothetical protein